MGLTCGMHVAPMEFVYKSLARRNFVIVGGDGEDERKIWIRGGVKLE